MTALVPIDEIKSIVPGNENIMILPEQHGFTVLIPDGTGKIKTVKRRIRLSEKAKEIYRFDSPAKRNNKEKLPFEIGAPGYNKINQITNLVPHFPKQGVDSNGNLIGYPYKEVDRRGKIKALRILCIAIGYTEFGQLIAVPREVEYNIDDLIVEYLQAKRKKYPDSAVYRPAGQPPKQGDTITYFETEWKTAKSGKRYPEETERTKKLTHSNWVEYPTDETMSLFVDYSHPEIQNCFDQTTQLRKKAMALVETQAQRNALKHHPAIAVQTVEGYYDAQSKDWVAEIIVSGFRGRLTAEDLTSLADRIAKGEQLNNIEIKKEDIIDKTTIDDITPDVNDEDDLNVPVDDSEPVNAEETISEKKQVDKSSAPTDQANKKDKALIERASRIWIMAKQDCPDEIVNTALDLGLFPQDSEERPGVDDVAELMKELNNTKIKIFTDWLEKKVKQKTLA